MIISKPKIISYEIIGRWWVKNIIYETDYYYKEKCYGILEKYKKPGEDWISFYSNTINLYCFKNIPIQQIQILYRELISC